MYGCLNKMHTGLDTHSFRHTILKDKHLDSMFQGVWQQESS